MYAGTLTAKEGALAMASRGFPVFRVKPNGKQPYRAGINEATTDLEKIKRWFQRKPDLNYGIRTDALAVLDFDTKKSRYPEEWLEDRAGLGPVPVTFTVATPSDGFHEYYQPSAPVGQRELAHTIDVRGVGGYVVGPGSAIDGKVYRICHDAPVAKLPQHVEVRCSRPGEAAEDNTTPLVELDKPEALVRGERLVENWPGAEQGQRNNTLFAVACKLKDFGISREMTHELLVEHWCPKCDPPYDAEQEIERTIASAYINGKEAPGVASADLEFEDVSDAVADILAKPGKAPVVPSEAAPTRTWHKLTDLMRKTFSPMKWIVPDILPEGCTLLAARPKIGKSWMCLDIALGVGGRGRCLGGREVEVGDVLYLALEDNERRMQDRVKRIIGNELTPSRFEYLSLGDGFTRGEEAIRELETWLKLHPGARLVVIDILARVRAQPNSKKQQYDLDYEALAALTKLAGQYRVSLLVVHHTKKGGHDPIEQVSGTHGITGGVDAYIVLAPNLGAERNEITMFGEGRDLGTLHLAVKFNRDTCCWEILGPASEPDDISDQVKFAITFVREALNRGPLPSKQLEARTLAVGISRATYDRARRKLGVKSARRGNAWLSMLPVDEEFERIEHLQT